MADVESSRGRRLEGDERRAQILDAATALYAERPFSDVSTTEIAVAAGVARGLLHHYFGTKRDLYLEAVRHLVRVPTIPPIDLDPSSSDDLWDRSVDFWLDLIAADRIAYLEAVDHGETGRDSELRRIVEESREAMADRVIVALGFDHLSAPPELRAMVRSFAAMAEEVSREWLVRGRLTRDQARVLLARSLPMVVRDVLPDILATAYPDQAAAVPT